MSEAGPKGKAALQPRAWGTLKLACKQDAGRTSIANLYQKGSLKALFPRMTANQLDSVFLNTAGGITGGDKYGYDIDVGARASLSLTSQAAERAYKTHGDQPGMISIKAKIGDDARLSWLPQETIVFDGAGLARTLTVEMASSAEFLCVEPMVFGRTAMGEVVQQAHISDQWRIFRDGKLIFADALRLTGDVGAKLARPAVANGALAMAALLFVSPSAEAKLASLRNAISAAGGASLIQDGVLFARILADDGFALRRHLIPAIETLSNTEIPKTWRL